LIEGLASLALKKLCPQTSSVWSLSVRFRSIIDRTPNTPLRQTVWQSSSGDFFIPLIHERPAFSERTEVGHFQVAAHSLNRGVKEITIVSKDWTVTWGQPFDITVADSLE
jgi:hypothetical protein